MAHRHDDSTTNSSHVSKNVYSTVRYHRKMQGERTVPQKIAGGKKRREQGETAYKGERRKGGGDKCGRGYTWGVMTPRSLRGRTTVARV